MINLLSPNTKQMLLFARRNTQLTKLCIGLGLGIVGMVVIIAAGILYLQQEANIYKQSVDRTKAQLKQQDEATTTAKVQDISNSLKLSVDVLSQEILFSKLLRQVGSVMPQRTVLQELSLSSDFEGALELQAGALDYQSASQVQVNLQDKGNKIFSKADLINIQCDEPATDDKPNPYPCRVSIRALFSEQNDFRLLNKEARP